MELMEIIKKYWQKAWVRYAAVGLAGILFGMIVLGWGLFPVQWTDATPEYLREDLKQDYLKMVIDSYSVNKNTALAKTRWESLGPDASGLFQKIQQTSGSDYAVGDLTVFSQIANVPLAEVQQPAATGAESQSIPGTTTLPGNTQKESNKGSGGLTIFLSLFCVLTLVLGFLVFYIFLKRGSFKQQRRQEYVSEEGETTSQEFAEDKGAEYFRAPGGEPVSQFMTTYMLGDDNYDDSFTIDSPMGDFLGECGVGISETIGVGDTKKVAAFEVWLFDKNDIQTVTKVLMSKHTFDDPSSKQGLMAKGEPILAEPGKTILLETATLVLEARIVDMNYGQGALPQGSFFDRLTLELALYPR